MSPWFRRRRKHPDTTPEQAAPESEPLAPEPEEALDAAAPLSPDRLDHALKRLRQEIPAPSEESPPRPSE